MPSTLIRRRVQLDPRAFAGEANANRTPGIHLTDVLHDVELTLNGGRSVYSGNGLTERDLEDYGLQGHLWEEEVMTGRLREKVRSTDGSALSIDRFVRLPEIALRLDGASAFYVDYTLPPEVIAELTKDHLLLTPDGWAYDPERLIEVKWCSKSANFDPDEPGKKGKRIWFWQVMGCLFAVSILLQRFVGLVEWHVQFPCGERKFGAEPPIYEQWMREYSAVEVMSIWTMVVDQIKWRTQMAEDGRGGGTDPHGWRRYLAA